MVPPPPSPASRRAGGLLVLGALAFHVLGSWSLPLVDRDEPRFAEATREMLERGDFVVPYFNGAYRFDKPPLTYWLQAACYRLLGEGELSARLPAAVAAALTALVILRFGLRLFGPRPALWAALLFTVSAQVVMHAKGAVADMPMVLAFALALRAGWEIVEGGRGRRAGWWALLAGALALGFLAKGPIAWLALPPILLLGRRAPARGAFYGGVAAALVASLAVVALWGVPALLRTDGRFLGVGIGKHVVSRSVDVLEGHGVKGLLGYLLLLPLYFGVIFLTFLPGALLLPFLVRRLWRREMPTPAARYLLASVLTVFLVFSFVRTKLPHYVLPAFPALSLLLMGHWFDAGRTERRPRRLVAAALVVWVAVFLAGFPFVADAAPSYRLARAAGDRVTPDMELAAHGYGEPSLVWCLRARSRRFLDLLRREEVADWLRRPGPRLAVLPTAVAREVELPAGEDWWTCRVEGFNVVRGRKVDLTLVLRRR